MYKIKLLLFSFFIGAFVLTCNVKADEVDICVKSKKEELKKPVSFDKTDEVTTKATGGNGVRHSAGKVVSQKAPAGFTIDKPAFAESLSQNGSEHSVSPINYVYDDEGRIIEVNVTIHARSPHGHFKGRGWQKVRLHGTMSKYLSDDLLVSLTKDCAKEIYGK